MTKVSSWRKNPQLIQKFRFLHHFVPSPDTKDRAVLLGSKYLNVYALLVILTFFLLRSTPAILPGVLGYASNISVEDLLNYTNKKRLESGSGVLILNKSLSDAAQKKAQHMFKNNYWAHVAPDGTKPWDFILSENYDYIYAGENLAKNFNTSKQVVEAWYDSPSHKENLLSRNYNEVGFAVVNGTLDGYETTLVVQMFGKSRNPLAVAEVTSGESTPENSSLVEEEQLITDVNLAPKVLDPEKIKELTQIDVSFNYADGYFIDVRSAAFVVNAVVLGFVLTLLSLDIWYSKKKGIVRLTGNTWVHLIYFVVAVAGVLIVLIPGKIL